MALNNIDIASATTTANKILQAIVSPISIENIDTPLSIGASIGVALTSPEASDFSTLFDQADQTMYRVKKSGKNAVLIHSR